MIPLHGLSAAEKLTVLEGEIKSQSSPSYLAIVLHGLMAGEINAGDDASMPDGMSRQECETWKRCYWRGYQCRAPETAKLPANPALAEDILKKRAQVRQYELENDLIGGGIE